MRSAGCWMKQPAYFWKHVTLIRKRQSPLVCSPGVCLGSAVSAPRTLSTHAGRKHKWSFSELKHRSERIADILRSNSNRRTRLSTNDIFNTLEGWMELSMHGDGITASREAHALLGALEKHARDVDHTVFIPKASFYDVVLQAFAVSRGGLVAAEAAQEVIDRMLYNCRNFDGNKFPLPEPSTKTFNIAINCWAKSRVRQAGQQAEALMRTMELWTDECRAQRAQDPSYPYMGAPANARTLTGVVDALSRSSQKDAPERALDILTAELHSHQSQSYEQPVRLDAAVVNAVVTAWVRSRRGREAATKTEEILNLLLRMEVTVDGTRVIPNTRTFSMVLDSWARCEAIENRGDAAQRAESILANMVRLYREGVDVKPNGICFTTCIAAWARCSRVHHAPDRANRLAEELVALYQESGDDDFRPSIEVWNAVLACWCRAIDRPDSMQRANEVMERLKKFSQPDLITYNTQLDGLSKRGCVRDALDLLTKLESQQKADLVSFNTVIAAVARGETRDATPEVAESILQRMLALGVTQPEVKPDKISYTLAIDSWSRSDDPRKALRARALVEDMIGRFQGGESALAPDVYVYTVLIKACAQTNGTLDDRRQALSIAFNAFHSMKQFCDPNHMTFSTLAVAINRLSDNDGQRTQYLKSTFTMCCQAGLLSKQVLISVQRGREDILALKPEWSRNVPKKDRPDSSKV